MAFRERVLVVADANLKLSGSAVATWGPGVAGPPCSFPYTLPDSAVTITGKIKDDDTLDLTFKFAPVPQNETHVCINTGKPAHTIGLAVKTLNVPYANLANATSFKITSPAPYDGPGTITVEPIEDNSGQ
jgi:hypothetical protein